MANIDIIRAWKDEEYRNSLTAEQRAALPANPAGAVELPENELNNVSGGLQLAAQQNGGVRFTGSWLCNCRNISKAMSATSSCCCYASN